MTDDHECRPLPSFARAYGREPRLDDVYLCKRCGQAWLVVPTRCQITEAPLKTFTKAEARP